MAQSTCKPIIMNPFPSQEPEFKLSIHPSGSGSIRYNASRSPSFPTCYLCQYLDQRTHTYTHRHEKENKNETSRLKTSFASNICQLLLLVYNNIMRTLHRKEEKKYLFDSLHWVFVGMVSWVISAGPWCHTKCLPLLRRPTQTTNLLPTELTHTEGLKASLLIHAIHLAWCETINYTTKGAGGWLVLGDTAVIDVHATHRLFIIEVARPFPISNCFELHFVIKCCELTVADDDQSQTKRREKGWKNLVWIEFQPRDRDLWEWHWQ